LGDFEEKTLLRFQKALIHSYEVYTFDKLKEELGKSAYCLVIQSNVFITEDSVDHLSRIFNENSGYDVLVPVSNETKVDLQRHLPPYFYQTPTVYSWVVKDIFSNYGNEVIETHEIDEFCLFFKSNLLNFLDGNYSFENLLRVIKTKGLRYGVAKGVYVHRYGNCYESPRIDLLPFISLDVKSLLDIGCARGLLGEIIKKRQNCRVEGVDIDASFDKWAADRLDKFICADIEKIAGTDKLGTYDCIICADVLEHLYDPYDVLQRLNAHLNREGLIIATVPNINNWAIIYELLNGRWDYVPFSILSGTHIRFFTKDNIIEMFSSSGYKVKEVHFTKFDIPEKGIRFIEDLKTVIKDIQYEELSVSEITVLANL